MKRLLLLLPLVLTGCGLGNPFDRTGAAITPDTPEQAACRREARNSDSVRALRRTISIGDNDRIVQDEINRAEERSFRDCLRERRLPGAGGVEIGPLR